MKFLGLPPESSLPALLLFVLSAGEILACRPPDLTGPRLSPRALLGRTTTTGFSFLCVFSSSSLCCAARISSSIMDSVRCLLERRRKGPLAAAASASGPRAAAAVLRSSAASEYLLK
ncbi:hypothetical protein EYF80_003414 [Liparis tanakae]|uniref:Secreted protein n=1 Tax=Liparis tanakae TaxID=230148 RepID=A0A4Z2J819_9TELE|nr:hypothetical protein EYF80_003414 [Liparis tanakae]